MDTTKKDNTENVVPEPKPTVDVVKKAPFNGVLALIREKVMREYGLTAEDYAKATVTIKNGELTVK